jgi:hypothetical protein
MEVGIQKMTIDCFEDEKFSEAKERKSIVI